MDYFDIRRDNTSFDDERILGCGEPVCDYPRECYNCDMQSTCQLGFSNPEIQDEYFSKYRSKNKSRGLSPEDFIERNI